MHSVLLNAKDIDFIPDALSSSTDHLTASRVFETHVQEAAPYERCLDGGYSVPPSANTVHVSVHMPTATHPPMQNTYCRAASAQNFTLDIRGNVP